MLVDTGTVKRLHEQPLDWFIVRCATRQHEYIFTHLLLDRLL